MGFGFSVGFGISVWIFYGVMVVDGGGWVAVGFLWVILGLCWVCERVSKRRRGKEIIQYCKKNEYFIE